MASSLWLVSGFLFAEETGSATDRIESFIQNLASFQADFTQVVYGQSGQELEVATGVVNLDAPGKFRWSYETPYIQFLISDGETLWIYDKDLEQVTISDIDLTRRNSPASILTGNANIQEHYEIVDLGQLDGYIWVELRSRNPEQEFDAIRLGFMDDQLSGLVLFDNLGQTTVIQFNDVRLNATTDQGLFSFEPPNGIDVIDSREQ